MCGSIVRHDDREVVIAVRASVSAGNGAEQIDAFRSAGIDEAADHFGQDRIFGRGLCRGNWGMGGHSDTVCTHVNAGREGMKMMMDWIGGASR
jgi:hypothetical protein